MSCVLVQTTVPVQLSLGAQPYTYLPAHPTKPGFDSSISILMRVMNRCVESL